MTRNSPCIVCGSTPVLATGRCRACYLFHRRHKRDRTQAEATALNLRRFEDRMERQIVRRGRIRTT